ncbi:MAG: hypothetical protein ACI9EF_000550 [Pseudohongiellaceae bacterium]|jgi:hypothetical protein
MLSKTVLVVLLATSLTANGFAQEAFAPAAKTKAPAAVAAAGVTGQITFKGDAPALAPVDVSSDPVCDGAHEGGLSRSTVVASERGGLMNVFVSLTGVPDERYKAPKEAVVLDQTGCTYNPHVFGIMKKQDLEIRNSDDTLHNIHAMPKKNKEFNLAMPTKGMKVTKEFKKDEEAILIKCDVHPWMTTWCFSMEHPYYGVSDADGNVTINAEKLPDGDYGVALWHETLGTAEATVSVAGGTGTFKAAFE